MIHHKDFPFDEESKEREIIHVRSSGNNATTTKIVILAFFFAFIMFGIKYLYDLGRGSTNAMDAPLITAEGDPYKEKPEDPGGMHIPHIDKEIFNGIDPNFVEGDRKISPIDQYEKPMATDAIANLIDEETKPKVTPKSKPAIKPKVIGVDGNVKSSTISSTNTRKAKKIDIDKVLAKQQTPEYWVQLGTFSSESKATKAWQDVSEKNQDLLKNITTKVSKSDLGEKGVFYRLKSGPLSSENEAKELCKKLNERKQNCFFVKDNS